MPQRFLRPGITTSDPWNACSFPAQSFYVRILTLVDDFGRYDGRIPVLHSHCFALRHEITREDTANFLQELVEHGLVQLYRVADKNYIQILKWQERARSEKSKFPDPPIRKRKAQHSAGKRSGAQEKDASLVPRSSPLHPRPIVIAPTQLRWSAAAGWEGKSADLEKEFKAAYPACDIPRTFLEMEQWLKANPTRAHKSNWRKFATNWLQKKQDRGGDAAAVARINGSYPKPKIGRDPDELMSEAAWQRKHGHN